MFAKHPPLLFFARLLMTVAASAQEFDRASGGELRMVAKQPSTLSGSLGFRLGSGKGFEGSVGGTLIADRMWFFASAMRADERRFAASLPLPQTSASVP